MLGEGNREVEGGGKKGVGWGVAWRGVEVKGGFGWTSD